MTSGSKMQIKVPGVLAGQPGKEGFAGFGGTGEPTKLNDSICISAVTAGTLSSMMDP
jgi:hypothetical protein